MSTGGEIGSLVDEHVRQTFGEQLERSLKDEETKKTLKALAGAGAKVSKSAIREVVYSREEDILKRLSAAIDGLHRTSESLYKAEKKLEHHPVSKLVPWFWIAAVLGMLVGPPTLLFLLGTDKSVLPIAAVWPLAVLPAWLLEAWQTRLSRQLSIPLRRTARQDAEERFLSALRDQTTAAIRESINERLTSFSTYFRLYDRRGLEELADPEREVPTTASDQLAELMASLRSGSIGLSGPRGAGKTTLIESFAHGRSTPIDSERMGLVVSAPVKYDAREFVLHLFASLCETVIGSDRLEGIASDGRSGTKIAAAARVLGLAALIFGIVGGAMLLFHRTAPQGPAETGGALLVVGGACAYVWLLLRLGSNRRVSKILAKASAWLTGISPGTAARTPERKAQDYLEEIRFQQSISSGWSGTIKAPLGFGIGNESSTTVTRTPWSLPEAVEAFRRYATTLTEDRYVVIGIDELDKMESDKAAREFLNSIKGVFGVARCYYLISVSDDAMSSFERRGLPVRDVFDSSFTAIQRVGYLTLGESRAVLESRVIGLPVPFQCFCHCMAGGLPRDLIRVARELVHQRDVSRKITLSALAGAVVEAELRGKKAAAIEVSRTAGGSDQAEWVKAWLYDWDVAARSVDALAAHHEQLVSWVCCDALLGNSHDGDKLSRTAIEVMVFGYYAATVLGLFARKDIGKFLASRGKASRIRPGAAGVLESLAEVRQQFAISPWLAWESIQGVRIATKMPAWGDPRDMSAAVPA